MDGSLGQPIDADATQAARAPAEIPAEHSEQLVRSHVAPGARILEVGSGAGRLARRLMAAGDRVTAIDVDAEAVAEARRRGVNALALDFLAGGEAGARRDDPSHEGVFGEPFDAVVFVLSLHHIASLEEAISRAHALLSPGGLLIADEFGHERADRETATWFYEMLDVLEAADAFEPQEDTPTEGRGHGHGDDHDDTPPPDDPLERWRHHHVHDPPLHTGDDMRAAISARFDIVGERSGAHLFRYPCRRLREGPVGMRVARQVLDHETRRIAEGTLRAVGLKIVARRKR